MNIHKNARLTPKGREILISRLERGEHPLDVATAMGISTSTVYKWWRRYRAEGFGGLVDRSSRPLASPHRTPDELEAKVIALRKQRRIYHRIAAEVGVSKATVGRIPTHHRLNRWRDLDPAEPVRRYERARPGEMIHIDIKKLGRFNQVGHRINGDRTGPRSGPNRGWEYVHVCIDDHLSLLLTPSGAETLVFWVSQPLPWLVAPKSVPLMTRRGDLKLSHGATAKARENAVKQDRVPTTNAIKSP